jgi:hypothetical protein
MCLATHLYSVDKTIIAVHDLYLYYTSITTIMPRQAKTPTTPLKPYTKPSTSSDEDVKPTPTKRQATPRQPWTPEDMVKIFEVVRKHGEGSKGFEGLIEGRTANQCYMTW